jgi:hypothetical protein
VGPILRSWGLRRSPDGVGDGGALGGSGGGGAAVLRRTGTAVAYAEELGKGINHSRAKALESKSKGGAHRLHHRHGEKQRRLELLPTARNGGEKGRWGSYR